MKDKQLQNEEEHSEVGDCEEDLSAKEAFLICLRAEV